MNPPTPAWVALCLIIALAPVEVYRWGGRVVAAADSAEQRTSLYLCFASVVSYRSHRRIADVESLAFAFLVGLGGLDGERVLFEVLDVDRDRFTDAELFYVDACTTFLFGKFMTHQFRNSQGERGERAQTTVKFVPYS